MRVSSVILPFSIGTLRSARMKTRLPRRSRAFMRLNPTSPAAPSLRATPACPPRRSRPKPHHFAFISATVASSMRLEKPHSLSYQAQTLTSVPSDTRVRPESKMALAGLWLKSEDTSGSLVYSSRPFRSVSEACFTALFTSSTVVGFFATNERSTIETLLVGTRIEKPSSLPFRCGSTRPTAAAAPVLVGIMLWVAERARRRSLWYTSVSTWSLVYECTVFISPETTPMRSSSALTSVARQFVVHDAFEITLSEAFRDLWLTP